MLEYTAVFYLSDSRDPNNGCSTMALYQEWWHTQAGFRLLPEKVNRGRKGSLRAPLKSIIPRVSSTRLCDFRAAPSPPKLSKLHTRWRPEWRVTAPGRHLQFWVLPKLPVGGHTQQGKRAQGLGRRQHPFFPSPQRPSSALMEWARENATHGDKVPPHSREPFRLSSSERWWVGRGTLADVLLKQSKTHLPWAVSSSFLPSWRAPCFLSSMAQCGYWSSGFKPVRLPRFCELVPFSRNSLSLSFIFQCR